MTAQRSLTSLAVAFLAGAALAAAAEPNPRFEPLKPLLGKTWRSQPSTPPGGKTVVDVQRWELALNGQAVRVLHSINDGEYGGESLIVWDQDQQSLVYFYFTTAGFYTAGKALSEGGALVTSEVVKGDADGITEVRGTTRVLPDGRMHVKTQYLKAGKWQDARDVHYVEDREAQVRFK
jgi:hypothetical protein